MSEIIKSKPGAAFWILGLVFLLWNGFGCYMYYLDVTLTDAAYAETYGQAMADVRNKYPTWSVAAYAIAVWSGLVAAIFYLLRRKWCVPLFMLSLVAAVISFIWGLTNAEARAAAGGTAWIMPVLVFAIGVFEIWWSRKKAADGTIS